MCRTRKTRDAVATYLLEQLLTADRVIALDTRQKTAALQQLLDVFSSTGAIDERVPVEKAVFSREVLMSTGMGYGIAVPHARVASVKEFAIALGVAEIGVPYSSLIDDRPVRLICMIVGPSGHDEDYLRILAMVMRFLKSEKGKILSAFSLEGVHAFTSGHDTSQGGPSGPGESEQS